MKRTDYCGKIEKKDLDKEVILMGWVQTRRDHGGLIFIDLRDREGIVQAVINPQVDKISHSRAREIRTEYVLALKGKVRLRPPGTVNLRLKTGEIEIQVEEIKILNECRPLPFPLESGDSVSEELRLKYRYLDLRRERLRDNIILRARVMQIIRNYLTENGFYEIETPFLTRSTPEGARDFLVPSRLNPGNFYALPQSPQLFKQILMIAGFDKYFQLVRCFRDEDLRADRQLEFTQLDLELSFGEREEIILLLEGMLKEIVEQVKGIKLAAPFPRLTFKEAMARYGTDTPDTRFGLELKEATSLLKDSNFKVFSQVIARGGLVKGFKIARAGGYSRKELNELTEQAVSYGAKGLAWFKVTGRGIESPIAKFFSASEINQIISLFEAVEGDLIIFVADQPRVVNNVLNSLRLDLGRRLKLIPPGKYNFVWIIDFPLFEYSEEEKRYVARHHPFTSPREEDLPYFETAPEKMRAKAYDLILNGSEIGGGSIRIYQKDLQERMFKTLGIDQKEAEEKFGFLLEALSLGAPPHGGIALGLDRLIMLLCQADSLREVIAFPKTQKGVCLLSNAPGKVEKRQLKELNLKLTSL